MNYVFDTFPTPLGDFSVALDENGAVAATAFGGRAALGKRLASAGLAPKASLRAEVRKQIRDYFSGRKKSFPSPLAARGTPFQTSVWRAMLRIPFGQTRTYGEIAREIGRPQACRAVGQASGANPVCLLIPCHRIIGTDGSLTGFAFGRETKRRLLEHEGALRRTTKNKPRPPR